MGGSGGFGTEGEAGPGTGSGHDATTTEFTSPLLRTCQLGKLVSFPAFQTNTPSVSKQLLLEDQDEGAKSRL